MPKCEVDSVLQDQVRQFMIENRLSFSGGAKILGVGRATFWRFCDTGRARRDTRTLYREALAKRNEKTATRGSDEATDEVAPAAKAHPTLQRVPADRELKQIRKACQGVLALLDVYEAHSMGRKI